MNVLASPSQTKSVHHFSPVVAANLSCQKIYEALAKFDVFQIPLFLYRLHQMHLRQPEPCCDAMRCSQSQLRDSPAGITAPQLRSIQK